MKRKTWYLLFGCEAVLLLFLCFLARWFPLSLSSLLAFPWEPAAAGLKALSGTGALGNGAAQALWVGFSLLPLLPASRYRKRSDTVPEAAALYALSGVLLLSLYGLINPQLFFPLLFETGEEFLPHFQAILGSSVWSVILLYGVLRLIRVLRVSSRNALLRYTQVLLQLLCLVFAAILLLFCERELSAAFSGAASLPDKVFALLRILTAVLPYGLDLAVVPPALDLLSIAQTPEQAGMEEAARALSRRCCLALGATAAITAGFHLAQLLFMRWLSHLSGSMELPLVSLAFAGILLLLSRVLAENTRLRDDNQLFI